jgi:hypothetical protein
MTGEITTETIARLPSPAIFGWALLALAPLLAATGRGLWTILLSLPLSAAIAVAHWLWKTAEHPELYEEAA